MSAALKAALEMGWDRHTSNDPDWSTDNPAAGQCAVTALVVQDYLGGELMRCEVDGVSHYFNEVDSGHVDWTFQQFEEPEEITPAEWRDREYVLSYPATARRYRRLARRVREVLA